MATVIAKGVLTNLLPRDAERCEVSGVGGTV